MSGSQPGALSAASAEHKLTEEVQWGSTPRFFRCMGRYRLLGSTPEPEEADQLVVPPANLMRGRALSVAEYDERGRVSFCLGRGRRHALRLSRKIVGFRRRAGGLGSVVRQRSRSYPINRINFV